MKPQFQDIASVPTQIPTELGCVVRRIPECHIQALPAWACTLWFQGRARFAIIPLCEAPDLLYLIRHYNGRPDFWASIND